MDFPVEATVHLSNFSNETKAREILRSHGFVLTDLSRGQVRVKGSFLKLKAAKALLEPLINSQTKMDIASSSFPGAIPKHYTKSSSEDNRGWSGSQKKPPSASPSSPTTPSSWASGSSNNHPTPPQNRASFSHRSSQRRPFTAGMESFVVDADVLCYAERLRGKDVDGILRRHGVEMRLSSLGESCNITLTGKSARTAAGELQSLLNELNKSLRTQEVHLNNIDHESKALLERIRKNSNIHNSVLVCQKNDKLHLIGPSGESYELKQMLLGRPVDQSGRRGRTMDKNSRWRSSSLPPIRNTKGDGGAVAYPSSAGAAGYSPSKYQDDKQERAEPKGKGSRFLGILKGRSHSEHRQKPRAERTYGNVQDMESQHLPPKSPKTGPWYLMEFKDVKKTFKNIRKNNVKQRSSK